MWRFVCITSADYINTQGTGQAHDTFVDSVNANTNILGWLNEHAYSHINE